MMKDVLTNALNVLILTPHIRKYLEQHDPKALEQAECALALTGAAKVVLLLSQQEAHVTMRALAEPGGAREDKLPRTWVANRIYSQLPPEQQVTEVMG